MKKILIPCDFSKPFIEALKFGVSYARSTKGSITVLHIIDIPTTADPIMAQTFTPDQSVTESLKRYAYQKFETIQKKYANDLKSIRLIVVEGPVGRMIREYAEQSSPDVIIMGTNGATGVREFFVGSNTEKVVRLSSVPVFAVRKAKDFSSIKHIVFPTSFELNQDDFIRELIALQKQCKATLHMLHVNLPGEKISAEDFEGLYQLYKMTNVTFNIRHARNLQDAILDFAKEKKTDLIAMATHGRRGLAHLFTGSVAESVANRVTGLMWSYVLKSPANKAKKQAK